MKHPHVVVILTDQQRWDCSGLEGNPLNLMPQFDQLGRGGAHVRYSFTSQPLCVPARACLQTGLYPTTVGSHVNGCHLPPRVPTLAHHFAGAGYRTAYIGKWHLAPQEYRGAVPKEYRGGYQDWLAANILELVSDANDCRLWDENGREHTLPGYRVDAVADAAISYLRKEHQQPVFLFLSFLEPHHQNSRDDFPAPEGYAERYLNRWLPPDLANLDDDGRRKLAGYCGMVKRLDEALGRICEALRGANMWDDTILLFTSDHGCHFKTRNAEYKRSCHESSIRVPTVFHGPGFNGLGDRQELVSLVDLPPTLLDAAGIPIPGDMQGRSLMPTLRGTGTWRDEVFVQVSESQNARALRTRRWKYCVTAVDSEENRANQEPNWPTYAESELYDLENDPAESNNLIGEVGTSQVTEELRRRLLSRMKEAGEPVPKIVGAESSRL